MMKRFIVSYVVTVDGVRADGSINMSCKAGFLNRKVTTEEIARILKKDGYSKVDSIVITNIIPLTEEEYQYWIA